MLPFHLFSPHFFWSEYSEGVDNATPKELFCASVHAHDQLMINNATTNYAVMNRRFLTQARHSLEPLKIPKWATDPWMANHNQSLGASYYFFVY